MNKGPNNSLKSENENIHSNYMIRRRKKRKLNKAGVMLSVTGVLLVMTGLLFLGTRFGLFTISSSASVESLDSNATLSDTTSDSASSVRSETTATLTPTPIPDNVPPVISGTSDITVLIGDTVSYRKNVQVQDNTDDKPSLDIDSSQVDLKTPGTYTVYYIATDSSGNRAEEEIKITVKPRTDSAYSMDEMLLQAEQILNEILEPGMTQLQQAEAIYWWTKQHIVYINHSDKSDWLQGAWQGINKGSGDCFNYFATAKLLLTQAGIENIDVIKSTGSHYWSLVNVGEGYYHFDTTPRKAGGEFFMLTDQEITSYSDQHDNSHVWDREKYPATPQE